MPMYFIPFNLLVVRTHSSTSFLGFRPIYFDLKARVRGRANPMSYIASRQLKANDGHCVDADECVCEMQTELRERAFVLDARAGPAANDSA